jgi:hypothetical protein
MGNPSGTQDPSHSPFSFDSEVGRFTLDDALKQGHRVIRLIKMSANRELLESQSSNLLLLSNNFGVGIPETCDLFLSHLERHDHMNDCHLNTSMLNLKMS